jgi:hypothetical protein
MRTAGLTPIFDRRLAHGVKIVTFFPSPINFFADQID